MTTPAAEKFAMFTHLGVGPHRVQTPLGPVTILSMVVTLNETTGAVEVDVQAEGFEDPHIRVINPPRYVPDPQGSVEMGGKRWRDDPLGALAHAVVQHGDPRGTIRRAAQ